MRHILLLALFVMAPSLACADHGGGHGSLTDSTGAHSSRQWGEMPDTREAQSAYPVELDVKGNSLRVKSKHHQVLPIYTQSGSLYLTMNLRPGVNWLSGLPRGRYRINNRTYRIN